LLYKRKYRGCQ